MNRRWEVRSAQALRWRVFDDEHVLYDARTGDTHLLEGAAADLVGALTEGPRSEAELAALLTRRGELSGAQAPIDPAEYVSRLVLRLARAGVIARARS